MKRFAVDLTSLSRIDGGYGYYTRNLLDGMLELDDPFRVYLITGSDNYNLFSNYESDERFELVRTDCFSASKSKRLIWVNKNLGKLLRSLDIEDCIEPYYCMPVINIRGIRFYTAIHDLQALHYPEFQSFKQNVWLRTMWHLVAKKAYLILTISNYSKSDIEEHFRRAQGKVHTVYIAVSTAHASRGVFDRLAVTYGVKRKKYYYTVSKLRKNKNFGVLIDMYCELRKRGEDVPKLLVSGSNGGDEQILLQRLKENGLEEDIILTGFISDEERNALYENAEVFLFPSLFEGFGMTPIEAMSFGTPVITTKCTSLYEVTQGKANYIDDPKDIDEWINKIHNYENHSSELDMSVYKTDYFAKQITDLIVDR